MLFGIVIRMIWEFPKIGVPYLGVLITYNKDIRVPYFRKLPYTNVPLKKHKKTAPLAHACPRVGFQFGSILQ